MNDKNKLTILIFIILVTTVAVIWLLIVPALSNIFKNSKDFLNQKTELVKIQKEVANFKDFDTNYDAYYGQISKMEKLIFNQVLIDGELSLDLIEFLKDEAASQGVIIKITPAGVGISSLETFKLLSFRLNVSGRFANCLNFISRIEHSRWLSEIDSVVVTKSEEIINMNLLLKVYAKNEPTVQN
jgi:hypothetical protein